MPESAIAEPEVSAPEGESSLQDKGFGNIEDAFDKAFPSTAKMPRVEPEPPEPSPSEPKPATPELAKPVEAPKLVPDNLFEPKPAPADEPRIEVPKHIKDPKQIANFEQMRNLYEGTKAESAKQAAEFARQIAEAKAQPVDQGATERISALEKQNQELLSKVERQNIQDHPKFQQEITVPMRQAFNDAHQLLKDAELDPKLLDRALSLQGPARLSALDDLYSQLPESAKAELAASVREIRSLDRKRQEILTNAHAASQELGKQDAITRHQQLEQHAQYMEKLSEAAVTHLRDVKGYEAFTKSDDPNDKWWNDDVDARLADAKNLLTKEEDQTQFALAAHLAVSAPFYRELALNNLQRAKKAEAEIKAIRGAEPRLDGEGASPISDDDEKLTFAQSVARGSGLR